MSPASLFIRQKIYITDNYQNGSAFWHCRLVLVVKMLNFALENVK